MVSIAFAFGYISQPIFLSFIDNKWYDTLLRAQPYGKTSNPPIIVDIDEKSLAQFGQWPWPRDRVGLLLEKIKRLGARSVSLDMVFPEPDRTSVDRSLDPPLTESDERLAAELSEGSFVMGYSFLFSEKEQETGRCDLQPVSVAFKKGSRGAEGSGFLFKAQGAVCSLKGLSGAARSSGFFNTIKDPDAQ